MTGSRWHGAKAGRSTRSRSKAKLDVVAGANWIKSVIDNDKPARVFVDVGGVGGGVVDILHSAGAAFI